MKTIIKQVLVLVSFAGLAVPLAACASTASPPGDEETDVTKQALHEAACKNGIADAYESLTPVGPSSNDCETIPESLSSDGTNYGTESCPNQFRAEFSPSGLESSR